MERHHFDVARARTAKQILCCLLNLAQYELEEVGVGTRKLNSSLPEPEPRVSYAAPLQNQIDKFFACLPDRT
jgi:hypothetical protein